MFVSFFITTHMALKVRGAPFATQRAQVFGALECGNATITNNGTSGLHELAVRRSKKGAFPWCPQRLRGQTECRSNHARAAEEGSTSIRMLTSTWKRTAVYQVFVESHCGFYSPRLAAHKVRHAHFFDCVQQMLDTLLSVAVNEGSQRSSPFTSPQMPDSPPCRSASVASK